jgi:alkanesulfonate monooxygenase SsuD/methylene tetrahydromethanopterin reductase-like flavin-dependent oxidoreductase (luciferase family)
MKFGVYLSSVGEYSDPTLLVELAQEAEEVGWDGVFIWDHIGQPNAAADPWVTLAAMAVKTEKVKIGPIVTPIARRRPWKLARETITVDHLSGGRLILGVGLGWSEQEFTVFGEEGELKIRAEKLDEGLSIIDGLWSGETFSFCGKHYQVKNASFWPQPIQKPRIPIWVCGAWGQKKVSFRRAARWDGVVSILAPGVNRAILPEEVRAIKEYTKQYREESRPFDIVVILWSEGGRSPDELQSTVEYAQAGVTWWLEDLSIERFSSLREVRERLHKGPSRG